MHAAAAVRVRSVTLADLGATEALARRLAHAARPGDMIALEGDLGAGKTAFARAFVHALQDRAGQPREDVPSPTFTLVQTYEIGPLAVWHLDLYRLSGPDEAWELGIEEAFADGIALIEWPDRLGPLLPPDRLTLKLEAIEADGRRAMLAAVGERGRRLLEAA